MPDETWTVGRILSWIEGYLGERDDATPRVSAQWLVSEALGVSRMQLYLDLERPLTADERAVLRDWTRRRAAGEPLQYITGEVGFRHITLKVGKGVLIPRPETEVLVSEALALLPPAAKPQDVLDEQIIAEYVALTQEASNDGFAAVNEGSVQKLRSLHSTLADSSGTLPLAAEGTNHIADAPYDVVRSCGAQLLVADICTGSGCIACSIAHERSDTHIVATDIAPEAVELAQRNATALGLDERIDVIGCDLADGVAFELLGAFDLVVSNPPYIPTEDLAALESQVADYEPRLALDGGVDGLNVFRRLLDWAKDALKPRGGLAVELHEACLDAAAVEAERAGFIDVRIVRDLAGKPRILTCRKR